MASALDSLPSHITLVEGELYKSKIEVLRMLGGCVISRGYELVEGNESNEGFLGKLGDKT